jgi:hypothetical protein
MTGWERLGAVRGARLIAARLQLHWAAQPVAAVGKLLLPHQADFGEQSLGWSEPTRCLAQGAVAAATPFRAALRLAPPALLLLAEDDRVLRELPLDGRTLEEAYDWMGRQSGELLAGPLPGELERPAGLEPLPAEIEARGGRFDAADAAAFAELARLFANAHRLLAAWAATCPGTSAVRCWPHHFDIATLAPLEAPAPAVAGDAGDETGEAAEDGDAGEAGEAAEGGDAGGGAGEAATADPERARTLGVGMVPGDGSRPEPYLYVTPWPYPESPELPPLPEGGCWHTEGWTGAVLEADRFLAPGSAGEQAARADLFIRSATHACRRLARS